MKSFGVTDLIAVGVCAAIFLLSAFLGVGDNYLGLAVLTAVMVPVFRDAGRSSLGAILLFSGVGLFVIPYLSLIHVNAGVQIAWFAAFLVVARVMLLFGESPGATVRPRASRGNLLVIAVALLGGLLLWSDDGIFQVSFYAGWAIAMFHLERLHASTKSVLVRLAGVGLFVVTIGAYMIFLWAGFGRIIFVSFMLAPILLTVRYDTVRLNPFLFAGAVAVLPFVGRVMRFGWSDGLAGLAEDSGASPITLTSTLWNNSSSVFNPGSIVEQWVLLFLGWVPRETWPDKPVGINSSFVDFFLGRQGLSLDHSTAIGFFGEHLFYLPTFWWVSVALLTAVIIVLRRLIARFCQPYVSAVIVFDVWLITLFWGGMASFSARAWFALLPMLAYVAAVRGIEVTRAGRVSQLARVG